MSRLPTYVFAWLDQLKEAAREKGADLIDLGMGNPDKPTPQPILEAIKKGVDDPENHRYPPFKGKENFTGAVAGWMNRRYGVQLDPKEEVLALTGSKEGLFQMCSSFLGENDVALVPDIYYPVHGRGPILAGGQVELLPLRPENGFLPDFDAIPPEVARKAKILFLNYPHNPNGATADLTFYKKAVDFCKKNGIVLVSDMAYGEIYYNRKHKPPSVLQVPGAKDVAIEFHSLSKSFNMAGFRLGFAVGNKDIINALYAIRTNSGYGTPNCIQDGGAEALNKAEQFLPDVVNTYKKRRDAMARGFRSLGWKVKAPLATLYMWLKVPKGFDSKGWTQHLMNKAGVVVTPGTAFGSGGEGFFRVSLVSPVEVIRKAIDRLKQNQIRFEA